jgi:hypothetical protein
MSPPAHPSTQSLIGQRLRDSEEIFSLLPPWFQLGIGAGELPAQLSDYAALVGPGKS